MGQTVRGIEMLVAERASVVANGGVWGCLPRLMTPTMRLTRNDECALACVPDAGLHHLQVWISSNILAHAHVVIVSAVSRTGPS